MDNRVERSLFTTRNLGSNSESVLAWRDSCGFIFDVNPVKSPEGAPFHAEIESYNFGSMVTSVCDSVGSKFLRTPVDAARNGVDHFLVQYYMKGRCGFSGDAENQLYRPGDIFVLDATRTTDSWTDDFRNLTLWIPRQMLESSMPDPDALHGRVIRRESPSAAILRNYLQSVHEQAAFMSKPEADTLVQPTLELVQSVLDATPDTREQVKSTINAATLLSVKRYIRDNLDSDKLTLDNIAGAVHVSRATLYRVCQPLGGVQHYIQQQRLRAVLSRLTDPNLLHLSIAQIAGFWGFHDASSFNRMFRREFGMSPSEARNEPGATVNGNSGERTGDLPVGDRNYEHWLTRLLA